MWLPAEHELLLRIIEAPDDLSLRLVLADLLTERGEALGELIVVQCRLERIRARQGHGPWHALKLREHELLDAHRARWHQLAAPFARELEFRRGLPEVLHTTAAALLEDGGLTVAAPILELSLSQLDATSTRELFALPLLARIDRLALHGIDGVGMFALPPFPPGIRQLRLSLDRIVGVEEAMRAGWFDRLEQLELAVHRLEPEALHYVERAPKLKRLELFGADERALFAWLPELERLLLARPTLTLEWQGQLYDAKSVSALRSSPKAAVAIEVIPVERELFGTPHVVSKVDRAYPMSLTVERLEDGGWLARRERVEAFRLDAELMLSLPAHPSRLTALALGEGFGALRFERWPARSLYEVGLPLPEGLALLVAAELGEALAQLRLELDRRGLRHWPATASCDDVLLGLDGTVKVMPPFRHVMVDEESSYRGIEDRRALGLPLYAELEGTVSGVAFGIGTALLHLLSGEPPVRLPRSRHWSTHDVIDISRELEAMSERPLLPSMLDEKWADLDGLVERALSKDAGWHLESLGDFARSARAHPRCATSEVLAQHVRLKQSAPR